VPCRIEKEIEVLEETENRKVRNERYDKQYLARSRLSGVLDLTSDQEINRRRCHHQQQKTPVPPSVEEVAGEQKQRILLPPSQSPIHSDNQREESEIDWRIKQHQVLPTDKWGSFQRLASKLQFLIAVP
jgi:hypothetical protein